MRVCVHADVHSPSQLQDSGAAVARRPTTTPSVPPSSFRPNLAPLRPSLSSLSLSLSLSSQPPVVCDNELCLLHFSLLVGGREESSGAAAAAAQAHWAGINPACLWPRLLRNPRPPLPEHESPDPTAVNPDRPPGGGGGVIGGWVPAFPPLHSSPYSAFTKDDSSCLMDQNRGEQTTTWGPNAAC